MQNILLNKTSLKNSSYKGIITPLYVLRVIDVQTKKKKLL